MYYVTIQILGSAAAFTLLASLEDFRGMIQGCLTTLLVLEIDDTAFAIVTATAPEPELSDGEVTWSIPEPGRLADLPLPLLDAWGFGMATLVPALMVLPVSTMVLTVISLAPAAMALPCNEDDWDSSTLAVMGLLFCAASIVVVGFSCLSSSVEDAAEEDEEEAAEAEAERAAALQQAETELAHGFVLEGSPVLELLHGVFAPAGKWADRPLYKSTAPGSDEELYWGRAKDRWYFSRHYSELAEEKKKQGFEPQVGRWEEEWQEE